MNPPTYIPYETLARAEADEALSNVPTALAGLTLEQLMVVKELMAGAHGRGMETAFAMVDNPPPRDPITSVEAYEAGIIEVKKER